MKPTVKKHKTLRGRINGYSAILRGVEGPVCSTSVEAVAGCEKAVADALARLDRGGRVFVWRGHAIVVMPTLEGWAYWIDTFAHDGYVVHRGPAVREDIEADALHHLAQNIWTLDVTDDETFIAGLPGRVQEELRGWFRFQRGYAAAKAKGATDDEAHRAGCEATS